MSAQTIFHITTPAAWEEAQEAGAYAADTLLSEGFIHCSTAKQLPRVLEAHFPGQRDLIALAIEPSLLRAPVRYEKPGDGDEEFPHIYGSIPVSAVTRVMQLYGGDPFTHVIG